MKRKAFLFLLYVLSIAIIVQVFPAFGQQADHRKLTEQSSVSILTMGPGQEAIFTVFGHTVIQVKDSLLHLNRTYNYGLFDFDQPNFFLNFAKGNLLYAMGKDKYKNTFRYYEYFNRTITSSELNLTLEQRQVMFDFLENNALPENKNYYYDYFYDNCATRPRDIINKLYKVEVPENYIDTGRTFREDVRYWAVDQPWGMLGIDLCLGLPIDKVMSPIEHTYLPMYFLEWLKAAKIDVGNGSKPLVKNNTILRQTTYVKGTVLPYWTPSKVFYIFLFMVIAFTVFGMLKRKSFKGFDAILFGVFGLLGIILSLISFATNHQAAAGNMNILWALPFHFIFAFLLFSKGKKPSSLVIKYFMMVGVLNLILFLVWPWLPQSLNPAVKPLVLVLLVRAINILYFRLDRPFLIKS